MSEEKQEEFFDKEAQPQMVVIPGGFGPFPERKPPTLKQVAWGLVWAMLIFFVVVALAALLITWLWNSNLAGVNGLPEIDVRTAASVVIFIKLAAFLWRGHR